MNEHRDTGSQNTCWVIFRNVIYFSTYGTYSHFLLYYGRENFVESCVQISFYFIFTTIEDNSFKCFCLNAPTILPYLTTETHNISIVLMFTSFVLNVICRLQNLRRPKYCLRPNTLTVHHCSYRSTLKLKTVSWLHSATASHLQRHKLVF